MPIDDEKLVKWLKMNPCLWDKNRKEFRLSSLKDAKWKEIATDLSTTRKLNCRNQFQKNNNKNNEKKNISS